MKQKKVFTISSGGFVAIEKDLKWNSIFQSQPKNEFYKRSFRKDATLTSWTIFSSQKGIFSTAGTLLWQEKSVLLFRVASFRSDFLQNTYFSNFFKVLIVRGNEKSSFKNWWHSIGDHIKFLNNLGSLEELRCVDLCALCYLERRRKLTISGF